MEVMRRIYYTQPSKWIADHVISVQNKWMKLKKWMIMNYGFQFIVSLNMDQINKNKC